jgi:kinesin family protein 15
MLCEDLAHATEQLNMLTEASKKHSGLLQSAQEELTRKEALIQELQHKVSGHSAAQTPATSSTVPTFLL